MLARSIRRRDLRKLLDELWDRKGVTPGAVRRMTPHEFACLFLKSGGDTDETTVDGGLAILERSNRDRADRGLPPQMPPSLLAAHDPRRPPDDFTAPAPAGVDLLTPNPRIPT